MRCSHRCFVNRNLLPVIWGGAEPLGDAGQLVQVWRNVLFFPVVNNKGKTTCGSQEVSWHKDETGQLVFNHLWPLVVRHHLSLEILYVLYEKDEPVFAACFQRPGCAICHMLLPQAEIYPSQRPSQVFLGADMGSEQGGLNGRSGPVTSVVFSFPDWFQKAANFLAAISQKRLVCAAFCHCWAAESSCCAMCILRIFTYVWWWYKSWRVALALLLAGELFSVIFKV